MKRINCPHCGKANCEVQTEDGGITALCSATGKVINHASRVSNPPDKKREVRSN